MLLRRGARCRLKFGLLKFIRPKSDVISHHDIIQLFRAQGAIRSQPVLVACQEIDPKHFILPDQYLNKTRFTQDHTTEASEADWVASGILSYVVTLEALFKSLKTGGRALDLGTGTGFTAACLAHLAGDQPKAVITLEKDATQLQMAKDNIQRFYPHLFERIDFRHTDAKEAPITWDGPFHAIHVGCAIPAVPTEWFSALRVGGSMVVPIIQTDSQKLVYYFKKNEQNDMVEIELLPQINYSAME